ncbi:MAG: positive regulator of sigma RseC/MucC [Herbinix sp.]|jgi:sigma-E factor negative regulatory protein RseC|nr:positive regulator of sigma RseC/MucC [Herbinix sp.]
MKESIECMIMEVGKDRVKARAKMHSDCSSCGMCEGSHAVYYEAINKANAKCGQSVILEVEKQSVLKVAFMVFVLPMLTIAFGSALGIYVAKYMHISSILAAILISLVTLIPTIIYIKKYDAKVQDKSSTPVITKILNE